MEKVMNKRLKGKFSIHAEDLACAGISIILGTLASPLSYTLAFLYVSYSYMRTIREAMISVFFILLCSLTRGILPAYSYALGFACYFVIIHMVKVMNQNLYQWMPYLTALLSAAFSVQQYGLHNTAVILPVLSFVLMQELFADYQWIQKGMLHNACMRGILLFTIGLLGVELLPVYAQEVIMITMLLIALSSNAWITVTVALMIYFLLDIRVLPALVLTVLLSVLKKDRKSAMLLLLGACFLYPDNTEDLIYLLLCMSGVLLVPANAASLHMSTELQNEQEYRLSQTSMLKRQMQNYANIFQSLSEYYAQISDVQAELLANMSNALQYNADAIRKIDGYEKDTVRVAKALEGYQYDVRELSIEEPKEGCIQVCVEIANIKRGEIRTTLLPLLEVLLYRNLQIADIRNRKFMRGYHSITVCDDIPFAIDAYADSVKNSYTSSGDTFSIFRFRQSVVCMISDGMGNGERAAQSSRLITNIFQRMMVSGIPQDSAIKCINKLIQSDTYATLDVICFNRSQGVAYISKSAACPTFLLRDDQIYEINGSALPVGIISQMQPDCFQVDVKAGDEYLMISDGIYMNEIYKWLNQRTQTSVKADVESFTELLKKTRRKDDSTIVLARVDEV